MKIYFPVVDTSEANAKLSLDALKIKINNTLRSVEAYGCLATDIAFGFGVAANTFGVWLNWPGAIQEVSFVNQAAATITPAVTILGDNGEELYSNFNEVNVDMFEAGKGYLIPYTAGAVTDIIPPSGIRPIESTTDFVFVHTHYFYKCEKNHAPRNGTSFTGVMFDINMEQAAKMIADKEIKTAQRESAFTTAATKGNLAPVRAQLARIGR